MSATKRGVLVPLLKVLFPRLVLDQLIQAIKGEAWKQAILTNGPVDSDVDGKQHTILPTRSGPPQTRQRTAYIP